MLNQAHSGFSRTARLSCRWRWLLPWVGLAWVAEPSGAQIVPDGSTGTQIQRRDNQHLITGGIRSGENLFHSFEQFSVESGQLANFIGSPELANILGRISGGDPSFINGVIQVSNSNANLFLMNPAGIVFGLDAQLDLQGSFMATTATGIGFSQGWFNASGEQNYQNLVGSPNRFVFTAAIGGSIVNEGNLAVAAGQSLTLLGGTVLNTGNLIAPGGSIQVRAIAGEGLVRLEQAGMVLGLEVEPLPGDGHGSTLGLNPLTLPELLTGGKVTHATALVLNPDGSVSLTHGGPGLSLGAGDVAFAGSANVNGDSLEQGGQIQVMGENHLEFLGWVSARGGDLGGDGGFIDLSGKGTLNLVGDWFNRVDLAAPQGIAGTLLFDPTDITIQAGSVGGIGGNPVTANILGATDISTFLNATGSLVITTESRSREAGNITLNSGAAISWSSGNSLTLNADRSITFNTNSSITSTSGDITLTATRNILLNPTSSITTTSGNITLAANTEETETGTFNGVDIRGTLTSGDGTILLSGISGDVGTSTAGVAVSGTVQTTGIGSIQLTGQGQVGNVGSFVTTGGLLQTTGSGTIAIHGQSLDSGNGIQVTAGAVRAVGSGSLNFVGNSGPNGGRAILLSGADLDSESGSISLTGDAYTQGIWLRIGSTIDSKTGQIFLNSTSETGSAILLESNSSVNSETSDIDIQGFGGTTAYGISLATDSKITSLGGNINLYGKAGDTGANTVYRWGTYLNIGQVTTTGLGNINITGIGGFDSSGSRGVQINNGFLVQTEQGNININGTAQQGQSSGNFGIVSGGTFQSLAGGDITMIGTAIGSTGNTNVGLQLGSANVSTTGNGSIRLTGSSSGLTPVSTGVVLDGAVLTVENGDLEISGQGANDGLRMVPAVSGTTGVREIPNILQAIGTGSIDLQGSGPIGIWLLGPQINANTGSITLASDTANLDNISSIPISTQISGQGTLTVQRLTASFDQTFDGSILNTLQDGFSQIIIGHPDASGTLSVTGNLTISDPILFRAPIGSGQIVQTNGFLTGIDNASITFLAQRDIQTADIITSGQPVSLTSLSGSITAGNLNTRGNNGGNINLIAQTAITTGTLDSSGSIGNGGHILIDPIGDVQGEHPTFEKRG